MRQRVGIAQAILHEPAILFLDEPTSGLDPQGVRTLREIIVGLNRDLRMTVFMNTHLLSEVTRTCTSIGVLRDGELAGGAVDQGQAPVTDVGRYRAVGAVRAAVSAASQRGVRGAAREAGLTAAGESGVD